MESNLNESRSSTPAKRKRVSRAAKPDSGDNISPKWDAEANLHSEETLNKLIDVLKKEGFNGDFSALHANHLSNFSLQLVRKFFNDMARWRDPQPEEPTIEGYKLLDT